MSSLAGQLVHTFMGRDLGGLRRRSPQKIWCIRPPNVSRNSVIGCVWKYELSKKEVSWRNFLFWNRSFLLHIRYQTVKRHKKYGRWLKKVIRNFRRWNGHFFLKTVIQKFSSPKLGAKSLPTHTFVIYLKQIINLWCKDSKPVIRHFLDIALEVGIGELRILQFCSCLWICHNFPSRNAIIMPYL